MTSEEERKLLVEKKHCFACRGMSDPSANCNRPYYAGVKDVPVTCPNFEAVGDEQWKERRRLLRIGRLGGAIFDFFVESIEDGSRDLAEILPYPDKTDKKGGSCKNQ